jgi:hypothetical protein
MRRIILISMFVWFSLRWSLPPVFQGQGPVGVPGRARLALVPILTQEQGII